MKQSRSVSDETCAIALLKRSYWTLCLVRKRLTQNGHVEAMEEVDNTHQSLLFKVASRVKFIVDSPETIWSCLDDCRLKESAERLLSAKLVYRTTKSADERVI